MKNITNRVDATNTLNKYINKMMPKIDTILSNGYNLKASGELFKQNKDEIYACLEKCKPIETIRFWLESTGYSTWIHFDIRYDAGEHWNYLEQSFYLFPTKEEYKPKEWNKLPVRSDMQVCKARTKLYSLNDEKQAIQDKISKLKNDYRNFLRS